MALEYDLNIKSKKIFSQKLGKYLISKEYIYEKKHEEKLVIFDLYKPLGFIISLFVIENKYFDYISNENQCIEKEWHYSSLISFRLDKDYDYLNVRINMLDIIIFILNQTKDDLLLLFNGDILILERTNGKIILNKNAGFWNSDKLIKKITIL
ncbi:hypothetical protein IUY40_00070 [Flavobacterium sp. ALJ2]|uniref:SitI3 family protein n=1 Tax=Flavobacterium sp. ALJ2 TaxID=2786960 RepID=UPI00189F41BC|nr:SitI3 family protein [Flavobacterium sp. ALJ2]MBF7089945.1 hypothetical protein [Flavobacterium sp. ALJ2]